MVHNRLDLFKKSVDSIFSNTNYQFSEILICNDGSNRGTTKHIFDYVVILSGIMQEYGSSGHNSVSTFSK